MQANVEGVNGVISHYTVAEFYPSFLEDAFSTDAKKAATEYADSLTAQAKYEAERDAKVAAWDGPNSGATRWGRGFHASYEAAPNDFQIVSHEDGWGHGQFTIYRSEAAAEKAGAKALKEAIAALNPEGA